MFYVTVERLVRRRPEIVWEHLTDVTAIPAWVEGAVEARVAGATERGVGLAIEIVRRSGRKRHAATVEVTAWRENELLALETRVPGLLLLDRVLLEKAPEGTRLGVYGELSFGDKLSELFAFPQGMLGATRELPWEGIYKRSVDALVKRIETSSEMPYR